MALVALLGLVELAALIESILEGSYDAHLNRAPAGRIVIAALGLLVALGALEAAVGELRGRRSRVGRGKGLVLTSLTIPMILLYMIVALASGPL
ncbi:MAG: hypothetical protein QOK19_1861 [Solirubrobacteraceae bacterium]|nr:hypothetical protein [Solirubrobacterales bacterium]MEA2216300.1 hypothetical protein [Solirubrobacteraceae bacterium]